MSESKHTPGPWVAENGGVYAGNRIVADCVADAWQRNHASNSEPNARLIAAAPDLLAALKALMPEGWGDDDTMDHMPGVKLAREAIAKAERAA